MQVYDSLLSDMDDIRGADCPEKHRADGPDGLLLSFFNDDDEVLILEWTKFLGEITVLGTSVNPRLWKFTKW